MFVFQKDPPSNVDLKEIDIFTAPLVGQPKPGSKYEFEKKRWKGENPAIKQRPSLPLVMNEWEIDPEAGLSIGWGLLTDMARGVGDQEIWKKYKMIDQTNAIVQNYKKNLKI